MCVTMLGQIVFMAIMFTGLVLTLVSFFTPAWRSFSARYNNAPTVNDLEHFNFGIVICSDDMFPKTTAAPTGSASAPVDNCKEWWNDQPTWEKVVIACMALAVVSQVVALVWTATTFCFCCCKKYLVHPLPPLAGLAAVFLVIAVAVFAAKNEDSIDTMPKSFKGLNAEATLSYSFYIACAAAVCMIADVIVGIVVVKIAKTPL